MKDAKRIRLLDNINSTFTKKVLPPGIGYILCLIDPDGPPAACYGNASEETILYLSKQMEMVVIESARFPKHPETKQ